MKKINNIISSKISALVLITVLGCMAFLSSCTKDETGIPPVTEGTPSISRVYYLDTLKGRKDSTIVSSEPYKLIVVSGTNIGGVVKAYINGYNVSFNPTYNTNTSIIMSIPGEVPTDSTGYGAKFNKIILETSHGTASIDFKIIAKPAVYSTDKNTFGADRGDITLTGKNFADVTSVVFSKTTTAVKIVAKTKDKVGTETMTLRFPTEAKLGNVTLDITNGSGTTTTKDFEFVNADIALKIFTEGFEKDWGNESWGDAAIVNSDQAYAGKKSMSQKYGGGAWGLAGYNNWYPSVEYDALADYTHLAFAIKSSKVDLPLWITTNLSNSGYGEYPDKNKIAVAFKNWTYYKIPLKDIDFAVKKMENGAVVPLKQLSWRVKGPDNGDEVVYWDDVMLVHK